MSTETRPHTTPWMDPILAEFGITDSISIRAAKAEMNYILNHINDRPSSAFRSACRAITLWVRTGQPLASPMAQGILVGRD